MALCRWSAALTVVFLGLPAALADWPRFRGPDGSGISADKTTTPTRWSPEANIAWKAELPGPGVSSPIVVKDRVFVTCYSGYGLDRENPGEMQDLKRHLLCFAAESGERLWTATIPAALPEDPYTGAGVPAHGYASHTPVSDGERVYVFLGKTGAAAFDFDGNKLWQTSVGMESDPWEWGSSSSPIVYEDLVIITASAESQAIVALDKASGKEIWRQEASGLDGVWSTPTLVKVDEERTDLVLSVPGELWGMNPQTGKLRWYSQSTEGEQVQSSAVNLGNVVYAMTGRGGGSVAVKAGGEGDVSDTNAVWNGRESARFGTPVVYEGKLYSIENNTLAVLDAATGEKVAQLQLKGGSRRGGGGRFGSLDYASPVIADDKLYYLSGSGDVFVIGIDGEPEQLAVNQVTAASETFGATPAISDGRIYLRSNEHLYCVAPLGEAPRPDPAASVNASRAAEEAEEEREAGPRRPGRGGPPEGRGPGGPGFGRGGGFDPSSIFDRRDENNDGKLTVAELSGSPMADRFNELDENGDTTLSKEEFENAIRNMFRGGNRGGGGPGERGGRGFGGRGGFGRGGQDESRPQRPQRPEMED